METNVTISAARPSDLGEIKKLLTVSGLPVAGVDDHWRTFVVARDRGVVVACGGCEPYDSAALIRSVAVDPGHRRTGLGRRIVRQLIDRLASRGLREFYLLTTTAEAYFKKRGFTTIEREEVNPQLLSSREFQDACPSTAVCMRLQMLS
jgi:N-acetylglutamate synthase-like GNAT family acetyltransferase